MDSILDAMMDSPLLESLLKLLFAASLGALIGLERGAHGRAAGMKTLSLVAVASALLMITSRTAGLAGITGGDGYIVNMDPSRMAAGIVTGIGFLGAGSIIRVGDTLIRGLTTAAYIWFVAGIGITVGNGDYFLAAASTVAALAIMAILNRLENQLSAVAYRNLHIEIDRNDMQCIEKSCHELLSKFRMKVQHVSYSFDFQQNVVTLSYDLSTRTSQRDADFLAELNKAVVLKKLRWS